MVGQTRPDSGFKRLRDNRPTLVDLFAPLGFGPRLGADYTLPQSQRLREDDQIWPPMLLPFALIWIAVTLTLADGRTTDGQ